MALVAKGVFTSPVALSGINRQANDGVAVGGPGERWLVTGNAHANGLWETASGDWQRVPELNESSDFVWGMENTIVRVRQGNRWGRSVFQYNGADNPTLGADTLYFEPVHVPADDVADTALESHLEGLLLYYVDANTVGLSPGRCYVPALGEMLVAAADQTATVPGGAHALNHAFLEEYPAGSGLGRLRLTTTEPGFPYLGSARAQSDDATARYLGMVKKEANSVLMRFQAEDMGGSTVFVQYYDFHNDSMLRAVRTVSGNTSVHMTDVGPDSPSAATRLISASARTAYVRAHMNGGTGPGSFGGDFLIGTPYLVEKNTSDYVFVKLGEGQELSGLVPFSSQSGVLDLYVAGYLDRR